MEKETAEQAHRRIMGETEESEEKNPKEEFFLGQEVEPEPEPEPEPEGEEEPAEGAKISFDAKAQSLADLRKAREQAEELLKSSQEENERLREEYEKRLASYDLRETREFKKSFLEPIQGNSQKISTLFRTYTGKELSQNDSFNFLNLSYQDALRTVSQHGIERSDKFMELWEDTQLIKQEMESALQEAPARLEKARLADSESDLAEKRLQAQRYQKTVSEVQSSIKTNVVGFIELADDPEYNAGVSRRVKEFELAASDPMSKDTSVLIAKGVVYDDLVQEVLSLREQLKKRSLSKTNVENASRISGVRPYSTPKKSSREDNRAAHERIMRG